MGREAAFCAAPHRPFLADFSTRPDSFCLSLGPLSQGTSATSDVAGNSSAQAPQKDLKTHPFYRLPLIPPCEVKSTFHVERVFSKSRPVLGSIGPLLTIQSQLKQPTLHWLEVQTLMTAVERQVALALQHPQSRDQRRPPSVVAEILAEAVLVVDSVHSACQAVGPKAGCEKWWPEFMEAMDPRWRFQPADLANPRARRNVEIANMLNSAMQAYWARIRPPASFLVPLKQLILCPPMCRKFSAIRWDPWRLDDKEWKESS